MLEIIKKRRSIRRFSSQAVEEDKLQAVLEAVRQAPSWHNSQCWKLIVIKDPGTRMRLSELSYVDSFFAPQGFKANPCQKGLAEAPVLIVACADPSKVRDYLGSALLYDRSGHCGSKSHALRSGTWSWNNFCRGF